MPTATASPPSCRTGDSEAAPKHRALLSAPPAHELPLQAFTPPLHPSAAPPAPRRALGHRAPPGLGQGREQGTSASPRGHGQRLLTRTGRGAPGNPQCRSPRAVPEEPRITHRGRWPRPAAGPPRPRVWVSGTGRTSVIAFPLVLTSFQQQQISASWSQQALFLHLSWLQVIESDCNLSPGSPVFRCTREVRECQVKPFHSPPPPPALH